MPEPELSIVVGTLNRRALLEKCLASIFDQTRAEVCVYVTDAGSTDGTIDYLKGLASDRLHPIFEGRKQGQAKAYNDVFKGISTPYVCWLSDDNEVVNHGLDIALDILRANPAIGMVGLKVKDQEGPFVKAPYIGGVSPAGILNVNQGLLRTEVLQEAGGFSEVFGLYGIDPDLTAKVLHSGHDIVYTRAVAIHHHRSWETDPASPAFAALKSHHEKFKRLYDAKYGHLGRFDLAWHVKRGTWWLIRKALGKRYSIHGTRSFLGYIARDWSNVLAARHISLFDLCRCGGDPFYLRQHCPRHKRDPSVLNDARIAQFRNLPEGSQAGAQANNEAS